MAADVGQTILQAAQGVVAQFQNQQRIQLQQLAMEQQLAASFQTMRAKEDALAEQKKLNDLTIKSKELELQIAQQKQQAVELAGGVEGLSGDIKTGRAKVEADIAHTKAQTSKLAREANTLGVSTLTPSQQIELRKSMSARVKELQETEATNALVNQSPRFRKFANMTVDDLKELQQEVNRAATRGASITDMLKLAVISNNPRLSQALSSQDNTAQTLQTDLSDMVSALGAAIISPPSDDQIRRAGVASGLLPDQIQGLFPGGYIDNPIRAAALKVFGSGPFVETPGAFTQLQQDVLSGNTMSFLNFARSAGIFEEDGRPKDRLGLQAFLLEVFGGDMQKALSFTQDAITEIRKEGK